MVRATRENQQAQREAWLRFGSTGFSMKRSQARARLAGKYWKMKQVAAKITREVPMQRQWAPVTEARGHDGLNAEEFKRQCSMWCLEEGKEGLCKMTGTCGEQARVMLWQGPAIVSTDRLARRMDRMARRMAWAPPAGVPSLRGENRKEFLQGCDGWYKSDTGQDMPCMVIEPSCQGGQSALVRFWCKEELVPWSKLTQEAEAAEGRAVVGSEKQKQNEAQLDKLQGQAASSAVVAFHEECSRQALHKQSRNGDAMQDAEQQEWSEQCDVCERRGISVQCPAVVEASPSISQKK